MSKIGQNVIIWIFMLENDEDEFHQMNLWNDQHKTRRIFLDLDVFLTLTRSVLLIWSQSNSWKCSLKFSTEVQDED